MKKTAFVLALLGATAGFAGGWKNIDDDNWISGAKLKESDLAGKVVLVDEWGYRCPPCLAMLPRIEQIWQSFKGKPFMVVGSHRQGKADEVAAVVKENGLTYPVYHGAGLAAGEPDNGRAIPFLYVVNHRGKVVYSGRSDREATQAIVEAVMKIGQMPSLTEGVIIRKYKSLQKGLVLGKPLKTAISALQKDVAKGQAKNATKAMRDKAAEAAEILESIKKGQAEAKEEIESSKATNPAEAVKLVKAYMVSFPEDAADYKAELPALVAAAKEKAKK